MDIIELRFYIHYRLRIERSRYQRRLLSRHIQLPLYATSSRFLVQVSIICYYLSRMMF